jgi:hypothetical protein
LGFDGQNLHCQVSVRMLFAYVILINLRASRAVTFKIHEYIVFKNFKR